MSDTKVIKNALIAYHANCVDGFTAAWVICRELERLNVPCDLISMRYGIEEDEQLLLDTLCTVSYSELYIVDYSFEIDALKFLGSRFPALTITVLDHHKTAFEMYNPTEPVTPTSTFKHKLEHTNATVILDNSESGASLCYRHVNGYGSPLPPLVAYVKDYDLWKFTLGEPTKWINKYIRTFDMELDVWDLIHDKLQDSYWGSKVLTIGKNLQAEHDNEVNKITLQAKTCTIAGEKGLYVMCPPEFSSDVGNELARKTGTYGAAFRRKEDGTEIWSLRSRGDYDVSALAQKHGGGGHKNAAGFKLDSADIALIELGIR